LPSSLGVKRLGIIISLSMTLTTTLQVLSAIVTGKIAVPISVDFQERFRVKVPPPLLRRTESAFKVSPVTPEDATETGYDFLPFPP